MALPLDDDGLFAEVRAAVQAQQTVPDEFVAAGRAALAWQSIDADLALAELRFDSAYDAALATRAGFESGGRMLAFEGGGVSVEIEVTGAGISGQVTPAGSCRISGQAAEGTFDETAADVVGCFVLGAPPRGPVRLRLTYPRQVVATSWVSLAEPG